MNRQELVEKMNDAFREVFQGNAEPEGGWGGASMDAALSVAIDELLKEPTPAEKKQMNSDFSRVSGQAGTSGWDNFFFALEQMFAGRRLERVKTPEERVTVGEGGTYPHYIWIVLRDGENVLHMLKSSYSREDAETYRLGLIQQLKDSA